MFRHNFKVSFRNLIRDKGYSIINIGGLALGFTVAILVSLWIWDEWSFNHNHLHKDHIAQLMRNANGGDERFTSTYHASAMGELLSTDYEQYFEQVVMVRKAEERMISFGDRHFSEMGSFMQAGAPELFSLNMLQGTRTGLEELNSILLARSLAEKLFGSGNPMGQSVNINGGVAVAVSGIFEDFPRNSTFWETTYISPLPLYFSVTGADPNTWDNYNMNIYAQLMPNTTAEAASLAIRNELKNHMEEEAAIAKQPELFLHPMNKWHLHDEFENGAAITSKRMKFLWINGLIGVFVLLLAGINFVNLSTARSAKRTKEIGVRKSLGSTRRQLFHQFMSESLLVALSAFFFSILMLILILPWFNELSDKAIQLPLTQPIFWLMALGFVLLTGFLAGSYPAFFLSALQPVQSLKGFFQRQGSAVSSRKVLVVFQFTISMVLLVGTLLIHQHIEHAKQRPLGYSQDGLLMLPKMFQDFYGRYDVFRTELKASGAVLEIAHADYPLTTTRGNNKGFSWPGKDPSFNPQFNTVHINEEYGQTVDWELVAGRDFSRAMGSDVNGVVITKSAQKIMNLTEPVGQQLSYEQEGGVSEFTILGVVEDLVKESPFQATMPAIMFLSKDELPWLFLKLNPELQTGEALASVENVFKELAPGVPFDFTFMDVAYATKFKSELQLGELATFFAVLALLISCLGVFGLAAYFAERRKKEVSVRRVLGASSLQLWSLLSKDFLQMVLLACVIATPIAWYFLQSWLATYSYRADIDWWIFALAAFLTLGITLLTVSYQTINAVFVNPAETLKNAS